MPTPSRSLHKAFVPQVPSAQGEGSGSRARTIKNQDQFHLNDNLNSSLLIKEFVSYLLSCNVYKGLRCNHQDKHSLVRDKLRDILHSLHRDLDKDLHTFVEYKFGGWGTRSLICTQVYNLAERLYIQTDSCRMECR